MDNILQNTVLSVFFALGLISGGIGSALNAANVQTNYDAALCGQTLSYSNSIENTICNDLKQLRDSQAVSAVSFSMIKYIYIYS